MSLTNEIEDSLLACREIEEKFADENGTLITDPGKERTGMPIEAVNEGMNETTGEEVPDEMPDAVPEKAPEEPDTAEVVPEASIKGSARSAAERHPVLRTILSIAVCIFSALVLSLLITGYAAHHTSVEGSSMEPSLSDGDQIIVENLSYYFHDPERFDVVVFPTQEGVSYIKRVIGMPGEAVWIYDGQIYINGELLVEEYGNESLEDPGMAAVEVQLGEDEYFVLGDNRNASIDSRQVDVGTVHRQDIKGRAWFRFYPFKKMGTIR